MNPNESTAPNNHKKLLLIIGGVVLLALIITAAVWFMRQPSREDFAALKNASLEEVAETQEKLAPALNTYLATFKKHTNETGSVEQAIVRSKGDHDAFKQAETAARQALDKLADSKAANDGEVGETAGQLVDTYTARVDYLASLAGSYADYEALFAGKDNDVCFDIFIGETTSVADRKERLARAAANCYQAIDTLKNSKNVTFSDYAKKLEKRVKLMESDATVVAGSEEKYKSFIVQKDKFEQQIADAEARNASDAEYAKILKDLQAMNRQIADNQADLDFSGKRYIRTVKELTPQREAVFSTDVPAQLDHLKSLGDVRLKTLRLILDDKLVEAS